MLAPIHQGYAPVCSDGGGRRGVAAAATAPALQYIAAPLPHTRVHTYIRTYETSDYSGQPNSILDVSKASKVRIFPGETQLKGHRN
jgi:hypothetical protein